MIVIGVAMMWSSYNATQYHSVRSEESKEYDACFIETSKGILEELAKIKESNRPDSVLEAVVASQIMILKRQDDLVNDIRQETNNNLEKTHALLSFWVGVMALLGILVPLLLQFKLRHNAEMEIEKIKEECHKLIGRIEESKKDLDYLNDKLRSQDCLNELSVVRIDSEYRLLPEMGYSQGVLRRIWAQAMDNFHTLVGLLFEHEKDCERTHIELIGYMVHISAALSIVARGTARGRYRSVRWCIGRIRGTIGIVARQEYKNWQELHNLLEVLVKDLRTVNFDDSDMR